MKAAVLLCCYMGEKYIYEQVMSIINQKKELYLDNKKIDIDLKIYISDDGSKDDTVNIVRILAEKYPDTIEFRQRIQPTGSAQKHFMRLLAEHAYGDAEYIMLSDQDDVWNAEKLVKSLEVMYREENRAGKGTPVLVHCDSRITDESLEEIAPSYVQYQKMSPERNRLSQLLVQNNVVGGALMMNRALALRCEKEPEFCVMHDQWIALTASAFGRIVFLPEALYAYRQHGNNVLGAAKGSRLLEILGRFGIGRADGKSKKEVDAQSKKVYTDMFRQAKSFLEIHGEALSAEQRAELEVFLQLPEMGRMHKIWTILMHGFTYNMMHRTIGECIFMP